MNKYCIKSTDLKGSKLNDADDKIVFSLQSYYSLEQIWC